MELNHTLIGQLAGIFALAGVFPYLFSILQGKTKPQRATYAIWTAVNVVSVSSYIASGATTTIWLGIVFTLNQIIILGLSFKYGIGGFNKLDIFCLTGAAISIALWIATNNPVVSLYLTIGIKVLGFLPTLKKAYLLPRTENALSWELSALASVLNMFALTSLDPKLSVFAIYNLIVDGSIALLLIYPHKRVKKSRQPTLNYIK